MRSWATDTLEILHDERGAVRAVRVVDLDWSGGTPSPIAGTEREIPCELVLIACGFTGPERTVFDAFGVALAQEGRPMPLTEAPGSHRCTMSNSSAPTEPASEIAKTPETPLFVAGDARSGASLVVSAIADALACVDEIMETLATR